MDQDELKELDRLVRERRDEARPSMELAVQTIDEALMAMTDLGMRRIHCGPDYWSWEEGLPSGVNKVYSVSSAIGNGADGYPLFTIRQIVGPTLEMNLVTSGLVLGPDRDAIRRSVTNSVVNHTGAFAGLRSTVDVSNREGPTRALLHAIRLGGMTPSDDLVADAELDGDHGLEFVPPKSGKRELN